MTGTESRKGYASPLDAYEAQTQYLNWRRTNPSADRLLHATQWSAQQPEPLGAITLVDKAQRFADSMASHNVWRITADEVIARADTVYLSDELHELVDTASATMPDEILFRTDVYSPCAMVFLERPILSEVSAGCLSDDIQQLVDNVLHYGGTVEGTRKYTKTSDGFIGGTDVYEICAFSWGDCESVYPYVNAEIAKRYGTDSKEYENALEQTRFIEADGSEYNLHGLTVGVYGRILSSEVDGLTMKLTHPALSKLTLIDSYVFLYNEDGFGIEQNALGGVMNEETFDRYREARRFLVALLRLMNEYVDIDTTRAPRSHSRRGARLGRINTESITTLALRRTLYGEGESGTGRKVTLAHLVRGHWRNQWYPSQQTHRARWINAHRRGGSATDEVVDKPRIVTVTK